MALFKPFFYKEFLKSFRNYTFYILLILFSFFGFSNPIIAKLMPEIFKLAESDLGGITLVLPEPTALDSWMQFFSNISTQLGLFILMFSSIFTIELSSGSIITMLTKGMPRHLIITSKFAFLVVVWTIMYYLTFFITYFYTPLLLTATLDNQLIMSFFPYFYGILLISISLWGGVITKSSIGSIVFPLLYTMLMSALSFISLPKDFIPAVLSRDSILLLTNEVSLSHFTIPTIATFFIIIFFIGTAIAIFNKQHI
ncbi:hypothetical protein RZE82_01800 [Mollicutes bacterium LVI A0039]|nr:hypothetical protein RZE82_01800 [Mollicutes bacterium LVI A0039]